MNKCLGAFLIFITIPLVALSVLELSLTQFKQAKIYKDAFKKTDSYARIKELLDNSVAKQNNELLSAVVGSIDAQWLQANIEKNLDAQFTYMSGKTKELNFDVNIAALKQGVLSQNALPTEVITGLPDKLTPQSLNQSIQNLQKSLAASMPPGESQNLEQNDFNSEIQKNSQTSRKAFHTANISAYIIYGLTILMLGLIALAARRWPPSIFNWIGQTLVYAGLLAGGLNFLGAFLFNRLNLKLAAEIGALVNPLIKYFFTAFSGRVQLISLIVSGVGLVLVILAIILGSTVKKPELSPSPAPIKPKTAQ